MENRKVAVGILLVGFFWANFSAYREARNETRKAQTEFSEYKRNHDQEAQVSPISKTLAIYEMNRDSDWVGKPGEAINISKTLRLQAIPKTENKVYFLRPGIRHESDLSSITTCRLIIDVPNTLKSTPSPWYEWNKNSLEKYTEYEKQIDLVAAGEYGRPPGMIQLDNPEPGKHTVVYKIKGADRDTKRIEVDEIKVDLIFP